MTATAISYVRDTCGKLIHLGLFESEAGVKVAEDSITLGINRAKVKETSRTYTVTKRGTELFTFKKVGERWELVDRFAVWWSSDEVYERFPRSGF